MRLSAIIAASLLVCASQPAFAAVITSLPGGAAVSLASSVSYGAQSGVLDGAAWSSTSQNTVSGWTRGYGFALNGDWSGAPMIGLNADTGTMTFTFDAPVQAVLADINWESYAANVTMSVFDTAGALLETASLSDMFAPGHLGFSRDDADIGSFALSNGYVGMRDLSVLGATVAARPTLEALSPVPEPASWVLMISGFGMLGAALRHRGAHRPAYAFA